MKIIRVNEPNISDQTTEDVDMQNVNYPPNLKDNRIIIVLSGSIKLYENSEMNVKNQNELISYNQNVCLG